MANGIMKILSEKFQSHDIRVVWMDGEPHWMFDAATKLAGHKTVKTTMTIVGRHAEFKDVAYMRTLKGAQYQDLRTMGEKFALNFGLSAKARQISLFTEAGLWLLIDKSDSEIGREYRRKFSADVAPQIARDGRYDPEREVVGGQLMSKGTPPHGIPVKEAAPFSERLRGLEAIERIVYTVSPRNRSQFVMKAIAGLFPSGRSGRRAAATDLVHADAPAALLEPPGPGWKAASLLIEEHGCSRRAFSAIVKELGLKGNPDMVYVAYGPTRYDARTLVPHTWYSPEAQRLIAEEVAIAEGVRAARRAVSKARATSGQESLPLDDLDDEEIH